MTMGSLVYALLLVTLAGLQERSHAYTITTSSGASGDLCPGSPQCLGNGQASCVGGKCRCLAPDNLGYGHFVCHRQNEKFCAVLNDPRIRGFDGSSASAPMSCKFKLAHLRMPICDTSDPDNVQTFLANGTCDIKVIAWGTRRRGKTFMKGLEVRALVMYNGDDYHQLTRIFTSAADGDYTFWESTNQAVFGAPTAGPALNLTIPGLGDIYTTYNPNDDNFAKVVAEMCGVEVAIRGVDTIRSPLERTAGVYIKVNTDCEPTYVTPESCLCSPPSGDGPTLQDHANQLARTAGRDVSLDIAAFHKVLTGNLPQDFPGAAQSLQQLMDTARACSPKLIVPAIEQCRFIMEDFKFVRCYDKTDNLETALTLLDKCLFSVCDENSVVCRIVKKSVAESKCALKTKQRTLLAVDC